jgi:hypothetical protein
LLGSAEQFGRKEVSQSIVRDRKDGILERNQTPFASQNNIDVRKLSDEERKKMALADFERAINTQGV